MAENEDERVESAKHYETERSECGDHWKQPMEICVEEKQTQRVKEEGEVRVAEKGDGHDEEDEVDHRLLFSFSLFSSSPTWFNKMRRLCSFIFVACDDIFCDLKLKKSRYCIFRSLSTF